MMLMWNQTSLCPFDADVRGEVEVAKTKNEENK